MIQVHKLVFNAFQENTIILSDETGKALIIDPGCYDRVEQQYLKSYIENNRLNPILLLNTHCHIDHVLGNYFVMQEYKLDLAIHQADLDTLLSVANYAHVYGFNGYQPSPEPTRFVKEGEKIQFGNSEVEVLFAPGHCPGHVAFYSVENHFVINGDILFRGSFGRTDLPGGDFQTLKNSILTTMFVLPDDTIVYCGHGPETTIGEEKRNNPIRYMEA